MTDTEPRETAPDADLNLAVEVAAIDMEYASGYDREHFRDALNTALANLNAMSNNELRP